MIGRTIGQYEIMAEIGCGGMGTVYRARQISLGRDVAIKILLSHQALDPASLERFRREGAAVAQIAHPNTIQILDVGEEDGLHYIAMEFVEGRTVTDLIKDRGAFEYPEATRIVCQISSALAAIQEKGLVHRDIKPSNILIRKDGVAKLGDFGVVALTDPAEGDRLTMTRTAVGTPYYMSPEQVKGRDLLTNASDVYSLGVVLYEMLAGEHPFGDATPTEAMIRQCNESFPPIRRYRSDIPDDLEHGLRRCLEKDKKDRFADASALHKTLEQIRIRLEMAALDDGKRTAEYRARSTGTNFFYVDPSMEAKSSLAGGLGVLFREVMAQTFDANRRARRELGRIYTQMVAARTRYKDAESQLVDLRNRRKYHQTKAAEFQAQSQRCIAEGRADDAESAAEQESGHARLGVDYERQIRESEGYVQQLRDSYDSLRKEQSQCADELALKDADSRRRGKLIPCGQINPGLARRATWVRRSLAIILLAAAGTGLFALGAWALRPRMGVPVATPILAKAPLIPAISSQSKDGLVLHYSFDKDEGSRVTDLSGKANHGSLQGPKWVPNGVSGGACEFNGNSGRIVSHSWRPHEQGTVAMWVQWDAVDGRIRPLLYEGGFLTLTLNHQLAMNNTIQLGVYDETCRPGVGAWIGGRTVPTSGTWHHIVGVYDGNGRNSVYVDGVLERSGAGHRPMANDKPLVFGNWADQFFFKGLMDEVRIYDRALDGKEVAALYERHRPRTVSSSKSLEAGLVLHYSFDKNEGERVTDLSGNGHDGILHGTKWTPDGAVGGARHFDGIRDSVDLGAEVCNDIRTISLWFNPDKDISRSSMTDYIALIHRDGDDGSGGNSVGLFFEGSAANTGGNIIFCRNIGATAGSVFSDSHEWKEGKWYHVVGTIDPVAGMAMYINGTRQSSRHPAARASSPLPSMKSSKPESIGRWGDYDARYFPGRIDEVRIYDRAMDLEEISQLYGKRLPGDGLTDGLVLQYSFDTWDGAKLQDLSGNGLDGIVHGATWTSNGVSGGAYIFNGSNAYVDVSSHVQALGLSSGSLSVWFKYQPNGASTGCPALYTMGARGDIYNYGYIYVGAAAGELSNESIYFKGPIKGRLHFYVPRGREYYHDNQWHHLVVVVDGVDNRIFVDGVRETVVFHYGSSTTSGQFLSRPGANRFCIGQDFNGPTYFRGMIDEMRIYNRSLSAADVSALYAKNVLRAGKRTDGSR